MWGYLMVEPLLVQLRQRAKVEEPSRTEVTRKGRVRTQRKISKRTGEVLEEKNISETGKKDIYVENTKSSKPSDSQFYDEKGRGYSVAPDVARRQEELSKSQGTIFYDEKGRGFSQDPSRVATNVSQNIYGQTEVKYASGRKEQYQASSYNSSYTRLPDEAYDVKKQVATNKPLTQEEILSRAKSTDLGTEFQKARDRKSLTGTIALGGLYFTTEAGKEVSRTPSYALEFATGYSYSDRTQGVPVLTSVIKTTKSIGQIPRSFVSDPIGTSGRVTGGILGAKGLSKISQKTGVSGAISESFATAKRSGFNFNRIPTSKDFWNVRYNVETYKGLDFEGYAVSGKSFIDIEQPQTTALTLYNRVYVRPVTKGFKGFSENVYRQPYVPSNVRVNFRDFSIQNKPFQAMPGSRRLTTSYSAPKQLTKQSNFIDLDSIYKELRSRATIKAPKSREFIYAPKYDDLGNIKPYRRSIPFNDVSVRVPLKDFTKSIRRNKSLRSSNFLDFGKVRKERIKLYLQKTNFKPIEYKSPKEFKYAPKYDDLGNIKPYRRSIPFNDVSVRVPLKDFTKSIRRNKSLRTPSVTDFSILAQKPQIISIISKSRSIRRNKALRDQPLENIPTSALLPFAKSERRVNFKSLSSIIAKPEVKSAPTERITSSGQILLLKPPQVKQKVKVKSKKKLIRKTTEAKPFTPSYAQAFTPSAYEFNAPSRSIPKYEFSAKVRQNFGFEKSSYKSTPYLSSIQSSKINYKNIYGSKIDTFTQRESQIFKQEQKLDSFQKQSQYFKQNQKFAQTQSFKTANIQAIAQVQFLETKQVQKSLLKTRLLTRTPTIPLIQERRKNKPKLLRKTFKPLKFKLDLNIRESKRKYDILPSLMNVFEYESRTGKEAIKPKKTKKVKRQFEAQLYGRNIYGSPIPVLQMQRFK